MAQSRTRWDIPWRARPLEEATNLNPAFCGELISRSISEYRRIKQSPFGFPLSFIVLPIVLHPATRSQLPGNASAAFVGWIAQHSPTLAELPDRTARLVPVTRESLLFLLQHQVIQFEAGGLVPGARPIRPASKPAQTTADADDARRAASLLGRWFANQGRASGIMQGLGVRL